MFMVYYNTAFMNTINYFIATFNSFLLIIEHFEFPVRVSNFCGLACTATTTTPVAIAEIIEWLLLERNSSFSLSS